MYSRDSKVEAGGGPERRAGIDKEREADKDPETQNGLGGGAGLGGTDTQNKVKC